MSEDSLAIDEVELIRRVVNGERELFRFLVLRFQNMIYSLFMRQLGDSATAQDLTQEVFVKAYSNLKSFRSDSKFSTWLVRIAINHSSAYFKSRSYRERKNQCDLKNREIGSYDNADGNLNLQQLQTALAQLKPKFREVVTLCGLEGQSYEQVARLLDIPVGTVRSRLNKARLILKDKLRAMDNEQ